MSQKDVYKTESNPRILLIERELSHANRYIALYHSARYIKDYNTVKRVKQCMLDSLQNIIEAKAMAPPLNNGHAYLDDKINVSIKNLKTILG